MNTRTDLARLSEPQRMLLARRIAVYRAARAPAGITNPQLIATVRMRAGATAAPADLEVHLRSRLPAPALPRTVRTLEEWPRLPNGKIDRAAVAAQCLDAAPETVLPQPAGDDWTPEQLAMREVWEKVLDRRPIGLHDNFFALGGDSLAAMRLLTLARERSLRISIGDLFNRPTIAALSKPGASAAAVSTPAVSAAAAEPSPEDPRIVRYQPAAAPTARLIVVHGIEGYGLLAGRLAARLPDALELISVESPEHPRLSIEETARNYLAALGDVLSERRRPVFIAGYCFGGVVAYEMARLEAARGFEPAGLFIIDAAVPRLIRPTVKRVIAVDGVGGLIRRFWNRLRPRRPAGGRRGTRETITEAAVPTGDPQYFAQISEDRWEITRTHIRSVLAYLPAEYAGRTVLARTPPENPLLTSDLGWNKCLVGKLSIREVITTHSLVIKEPAVDSLAEILWEEMGFPPMISKFDEATALAG